MSVYNRVTVLVSKKKKQLIYFSNSRKSWLCTHPGYKGPVIPACCGLCVQWLQMCHLQVSLMTTQGIWWWAFLCSLTQKDRESLWKGKWLGREMIGDLKMSTSSFLRMTYSLGSAIRFTVGWWFTMTRFSLSSLFLSITQGNLCLFFTFSTRSPISTDSRN